MTFFQQTKTPSLKEEHASLHRELDQIGEDWCSEVPMILFDPCTRAGQGDGFRQFTREDIINQIKFFITEEKDLVQKMLYIQEESEILDQMDDTEMLQDMEEFCDEQKIDAYFDLLDLEYQLLDRRISDYEMFESLIDDELPEEILTSLENFEEDLDYENSLWEENKACEKQKINLHRLLACEDVEKRPGWCGYLSVYDESQKERYTWSIEIITSFPKDSKKGYALGKTPYGLVFFAEKFRGYIPAPGSFLTTTVALQTSENLLNRKKSFPFTAIYTHQ